ncbi:pyruvate kinase [Chloroflexota bacterium]
MKKLIITVGPSILQNTLLVEIHNENYIYRINGAHGTVEDISQYVAEIRSQLPQADILLDLPGNKIRTANLDEPIELRKGQRFRLLNHHLNFQDYYKYFKPGDIVLADDSTLKFRVESVSEKEMSFSSQSEGQLRTNKGLHASGIHQNIPFLFEKDKELIQLANRLKLSYLGLSFVRNVEDINLAAGLISPEITIISKIETRAAIDNLNDILQSVEYILVDRGDLSTDIGLARIPAYQRFIVEKANFFNKRVFLSTQFLKNMEEKPVPTIAEVIDLYNTFKMGVYGIQLSEETSIGKYPRECLDIVNMVLVQIESETR